MTAVVVTRCCGSGNGSCNIWCRDGEAILTTSAANAGAALVVRMSSHHAGMILRRRRRRCHSLLTQCKGSGVRLMALNTRRCWRLRLWHDRLVLLLLLFSLFHPWFPKSFPIVHKPIRQLLQFDTRIEPYLCLLLFGGVWMGNVFRRHHPGLEIFDGFWGEGGGLSTGRRRSLLGVVVIISSRE